MELRNSRYNCHGGIDAEVNTSAFGWIVTTLEPGPLYDRALASCPAAYVAPKVDPLVERTKMKLTFAQFVIGLVTEGWITEGEAENWLAGTLPLALVELIDALPKPHRFAARARALRPAEVLRLDTLVSALASGHGKTPEQIDQFFRDFG